MQKVFFLFFILCGIAWPGLADNAPKQATPLLVGGNFSVQSNNPVKTRAFDQQARDAEVATLQNKLRNGQYNEVIKRINTLTANNFMDDRFYCF